MFRIAPIALIASLCSILAAQTANGTIANVSADQAAANAAANGSVTEPAPKPRPAKEPPVQFAGLAHLEMSASSDGLNAFVHGAEPGFLGVLVLSLTPNLTHFFTGLPPMLTDSVVVAFGVTKTQDLDLAAPLQMPKTATKIFGQALILDDEGLWASGIVPLVVGPKGQPAQPVTM